MDQVSGGADRARSLLDANLRFYDALWRDTRLVEPSRFNTWPLVCSLVSRTAQRRLEVAPGLRPRLPIEGTQFLDASAPAVAKLLARGADAVRGEVTSLPFDDETFDLVCALDIVEHVDDDESAWSELARVAAPSARVLLSVPLHPSHWTAFDDFVGHRRRYEPDRLLARLAQNHFTVEQSAIFGMQPKSSRLVDLGMWYLTHRRAKAMWCYNHLFMPLGVHFQKRLAFEPGLIDTEKVDEILLVCRKTGAVA
jgi:SAM-dependent methyltransferase